MNLHYVANKSEDKTLTFFTLLLSFLGIFMLSGCTKVSQTVSTPTPQVVIQPIQNAEEKPSINHIYLPLIDNEPFSIWTASYLPPDFATALHDTFSSLLTTEPNSSTIKFEVGTQNIISEWVYALVAPFPAVTQGISESDLLAFWQGQSTGAYFGQPMLMDESTYGMISAFWGPAQEGTVKLVNSDEIVEYAWAHQPSWAIVPFNSLEPRWKVLEIDGRSPLHKSFDPTQYSLTIPISLSGDPTLVDLVKSSYGSTFNSPLFLSTNRDPEKFTTLAMTGVTALVRATAFSMEIQGITYPSQDIRTWLQDADFTHISNEVPFAETCPAPDPLQRGVRFCSRDSYIGLLEDIGTDIVELSGDHFQDWGSNAVLHTLDLYKERGWYYYGGGVNLGDGRKALLLEHNNNHLALIGCNAKGGSFAQASETNPGAAACDMDWMAQEISSLQQEGYITIATFQHQEYYDYVSHPDQQRDFRRMAEAGAAIVSGSQAHQPQAIEFDNNSFIHYGLGNLFFDQYDLCLACRQGVIDLHVFYDGRYISTELLPIQFIDYARPRPMTSEEKINFLNTLFLASGW